MNATLKIIYREKPHDVEWLELIKVKVPLLLNYAQCKLIQKEYYEVIEHCSEVLKHEPSKLFTGQIYRLKKLKKKKKTHFLQTMSRHYIDVQKPMSAHGIQMMQKKIFKPV